LEYGERLAQAGIKPFFGSEGDSHDNALVETIDGLYKAELTYRRAPWKMPKMKIMHSVNFVYTLFEDDSGDVYSLPDYSYR
jgi:transposase InsO family protein